MSQPRSYDSHHCHPSLRSSLCLSSVQCYPSPSLAALQCSWLLCGGMPLVLLYILFTVLWLYRDIVCLGGVHLWMMFTVTCTTYVFIWLYEGFQVLGGGRVCFSRDNGLQGLYIPLGDMFMQACVGYMCDILYIFY